MIGPTGADRRDAMVNPFQEKYGITVEYFSERKPGIGPLIKEPKDKKTFWPSFVRW